MAQKDDSFEGELTVYMIEQGMSRKQRWRGNFAGKMRYVAYQFCQVEKENVIINYKKALEYILVCIGKQLNWNEKYLIDKTVYLKAVAQYFYEMYKRENENKFLKVRKVSQVNVNTLSDHGKLYLKILKILQMKMYDPYDFTYHWPTFKVIKKNRSNQEYISNQLLCKIRLNVLNELKKINQT